MAIKLTIAIPTYNRAQLLKATVESVIQQCRPDDNYEIIICDNASTDETSLIVERLQSQDKNIRYLKNDRNLGFDANIKKCFEQAGGEYIFLLSDDDIVLPGTISAIFENISNVTPAIIALSHYGFLGNDPYRKIREFFPLTDIAFESGANFFKYAGLGFLSSLILKMEFVRKYLDNIQPERGCAHLDVASRIALKEKGPFVFLGTKPVAARMPEQSPAGYDLMRYGFIYVNQLYKELVSEGLLSDEYLLKREKKLLRTLIPRYVLNQIATGDRDRIYGQRELIGNEFQAHWEYYILVAPIFFIPRFLLVIPYKAVRWLLNVVRDIRYNKL